MADTKREEIKKQMPNEGEGSKTAGREYDKDTRKFVEETDVEAQAKKAEKARETGEREEMDEAEREGLKHAKH